MLVTSTEKEAGLTEGSETSGADTAESSLCVSKRLPGGSQHPTKQVLEAISSCTLFLIGDVPKKKK